MVHIFFRKSTDEFYLSMDDDDEWEAFEAMPVDMAFLLPPPFKHTTTTRRPKVPVSDDLKDEKYLQHRRINNEQSKRSRLKAKMQQDAQKAAMEQLLVDNQRLELEMERLQATMKSLIGQVRFNRTA